MPPPSRVFWNWGISSSTNTSGPWFLALGWAGRARQTGAGRLRAIVLVSMATHGGQATAEDDARICQVRWP